MKHPSFAIPITKIEELKRSLNTTIIETAKNQCSRGHLIDAYERVAVAMFYHGDYGLET